MEKLRRAEPGHPQAPLSTVLWSQCSETGTETTMNQTQLDPTGMNQAKKVSMNGG